MNRTSKRIASFPRLMELPENHSAWAAVHGLAAGMVSGQLEGWPNPLYLHGPAGVGKSCLVNALAAEVLRNARQLVIASMTAQEADSLLGLNATTNGHGAADQVDLLIIEDLQQLAPRFTDSLAHLVDELKRRRVPMVFTALAGPRFLPFSGRLRSRLASGLVVGLQSLQAPSRLKFLQAKAQERQLAVCPEILGWLAERLRGSGRELEGALIRLEALCRLHHYSLNIAGVARHFQEDIEATKPTLERIVQQVSNCFRVSAAQLLSGRRDRHVLIPRQIAMYLSRRLTSLSLGEIGDRFGGRDHSTVLHGCRKVAAILMNDTALAGTVLQLQAALM